VKIGRVGAVIDLPLGHKDDVWSFDQIDTLSIMVPNAPRSAEIAVIVALADGGAAASARRQVRRCAAGRRSGGFIASVGARLKAGRAGLFPRTATAPCSRGRYGDPGWDVVGAKH
jgi:hypothetical protein